MPHSSGVPSTSSQTAEVYMSHRTFSAVALATTGVLALTALGVPAATAAGTGVTGASSPQQLKHPVSVCRRRG